MSTATPTITTAAYSPSLVTAASHHRCMPAARRAPMSQNTVIRPNPTRKNRPDHLVPAARPRHTPATQRHGRAPSHGP